jgi:hypothetical protein
MFKIKSLNKVAVFLICIGGLLLIVGMTVALRTVKPMYVNIISGLIILTGTFFGLFGKQLQDKNSSEKSDKILTTGENTYEKVDNLKTQNNELKNQATTLTSKIDTQANTIDKLRTENADLYSKLAGQSKEIYNQVTGGDSYCVFEVFFDNETNKPAFNLKHVGKTVLRNVIVSIEDYARRAFLVQTLAKNDWSSPLVSDIINKTHYQLEYPSLYPTTSVENIGIPIEEGQQNIKMSIWIHLDNGQLFETLDVENFKQKNMSYKLELKKGDKVLEKR